MIRETDSKHDRFLAILFGSAFIFYHLLIDQYYRLSADDFSGWGYAQQGIPGLSYAWHYYQSWEGPFLSMFLQGISMWLVGIGIPPAAVLLATKLAVTASFYYLLIGLTFQWPSAPSKAKIWLASLSMTIALYTISPAPNETWHWLIGISYLYPVIFLLLGVGDLLRGRVLLAALPFAFVVQSNATYSTILFGALFLLAILMSRLKPIERKEWTTLVILLLLFLGIYLVAPGNYVRLEHHSETGPNPILQFMKGLKNLVISYNLAKMDRIVLCILALSPLASGLPKALLPKNVWHWLIPIAAYLIFIVVHGALFVFVTGYCEWPRVLTLHSFLFLITSITYGVWIFYIVPFKMGAIRKWIYVFGILGATMVMYKNVTSEIDSAKTMSINYDKRNEQIFSFVGTSNDTLVIDPINYGGKLYFVDFSTDPDNWINKDFKKAYGLQFKVATRKD